MAQVLLTSCSFSPKQLTLLLCQLLAARTESPIVEIAIDIKWINITVDHELPEAASSATLASRPLPFIYYIDHISCV